MKPAAEDHHWAGDGGFQAQRLALIEQLPIGRALALEEYFLDAPFLEFFDRFFGIFLAQQDKGAGGHLGQFVEAPVDLNVKRGVLAGIHGVNLQPVLDERAMDALDEDFILAA